MNFIFLFLAVVVIVPYSAGQMSCDVVPIETWASSPSGYLQELPRPVELVVVTHTITVGCDTDDACERISRSIRNTHMQQGFTDVRLSFLVGGNGKIYEGAGWKVGSHTSGFNDRAISLSFIGDFTDTIPTEAALNVAEEFLGCYLNSRTLGCGYKLVGHRQLISTSSPGDALQNLIQTWPRWTENI